MSNDRNVNRLGSRFFRGNDWSQKRRTPKFTREVIENYSTANSDSTISVYFDDIEDLVIELSSSFSVAVGAVAWLTNFKILQALSEMERVAIVVQKEDFLRRDLEISSEEWREQLHSRYSALKGYRVDDFSLDAYPGVMDDDPDYNPAVQRWLFDASGLFQRAGDAIRCLGYARRARREIPRMHHKFLVLGDRDDALIIRPRCLLTGSFNMTHNAVRSRENVLVIKDATIIQAYVSEWAQLWCLSEALNWHSPEPEVQTLDMST